MSQKSLTYPADTTTRGFQDVLLEVFRDLRSLRHLHLIGFTVVPPPKLAEPQGSNFQPEYTKRLRDYLLEVNAKLPWLKSVAGVDVYRGEQFTFQCGFRDGGRNPKIDVWYTQDQSPKWEFALY